MKSTTLSLLLIILATVFCGYGAVAGSTPVGEAEEEDYRQSGRGAGETSPGARLLFSRWFKEDLVVINRNLTVQLTIDNIGDQPYAQP